LKSPRIRPLTFNERELAREVFGKAIGLDRVRVFRSPWPLVRAFVHEMVHVWQAQQGVNLLFAKIRAGDSTASYTYPVSDMCHWDGLNIEQQAMVVEHRFRLSRGMKVPADMLFYDRVCPIGREPDDKIIA